MMEAAYLEAMPDYQPIIGSSNMALVLFIISQSTIMFAQFIVSEIMPDN